MSIINQHIPFRGGTRVGYERDHYVMHFWSGDRDKSKWPDPHEYELIMPTEYRNIQHVSLLTCEFCSSAYTINSSNNNVLIGVASFANSLVVTIEPGSYTPPNMAIALSDAINAAGAIYQTTTVTYDVSTRKFTINSAGGGNGISFLINDSITPASPNYSTSLAGKYIWDKLGFTVTTANLSAAIGSSFEASEIANLKEDRFLIMEIAQPAIMTGHMNSSGAHFHPFAKIIFDTESSVDFPGQSSVYDFVSSPVNFKNIGKIDRMKFRFRRPNGNFYDFHKLEHSFTLEFVTK